MSRQISTRNSGAGHKSINFGVGMKEGVSLLKSVERCMRRPMKLKTSLHMLEQGHEYDRCCEQLLFGPSFFSGSTAGGSSEGGTLRGDSCSAGHTSRVSLDDDPLRRGGAATPSQQQPPLSVTVMEDGVDVGPGNGNASLELDLNGIGDFGFRLFNKAKKVPGRSETVAMEYAFLRKPQKEQTQPRGPLATAASPHVVPEEDEVTTSEIVRTAASVSHLRTRDDDDAATQLFYSDFTQSDIVAQLKMLEQEQAMEDVLRRRFQETEEGRALLAGLRARVLHVREDNEASSGGSHRGSSTTTTLPSLSAKTKVLSPQLVPATTSFDWNVSPTKAVLPPVERPLRRAGNLNNSGDAPISPVTGADATHPQAQRSAFVAGVCHVEPSPLRGGATRLAPLAAPVSFSVAEMQHRGVEAGVGGGVSPLRQLRALVVSSVQPRRRAKPLCDGQNGAPCVPEARHGGDVDFSDSRNGDCNLALHSLEQIGSSSAVRKAAAASLLSPEYGVRPVAVTENPAEFSAPLWLFEIQKCLSEVEQQFTSGTHT